MNYYCHRNNWISKNQFGFQEGIGAEDGALNLANIISNGFKTRHHTLVVFFDISGAFNDLWKDGFIYRMIQNKCPYGMIRWLDSYLTGRTVVCKETGCSKSLTKSTPQGAVISPLIWNLFFDSILRMLQRRGLIAQCFADDTCVAIQGKDISKLEKDMNLCLKWVSAWAKCFKIQFNTSKTKAVLFSRARKTKDLRLYMNQTEIEMVNNFKYLGIFFDNKLNWKKHISEVCKKAKNLVHHLKRGISVKWGMSGEAFKSIYESAILPVVNYGAIVWGSALKFKCHQEQLERVQRQAMLSISGVLRTTSTSALQVITSLPPIYLKIQEKIIRHTSRIASNPEVGERLSLASTLEEHCSSPHHTSSLEFFFF